MRAHLLTSGVAIVALVAATSGPADHRVEVEVRRGVDRPVLDQRSGSSNVRSGGYVRHGRGGLVAIQRDRLLMRLLRPRALLHGLRQGEALLEILYAFLRFSCGKNKRVSYTSRV